MQSIDLGMVPTVRVLKSDKIGLDHVTSLDILYCLKTCAFVAHTTQVSCPNRTRLLASAPLFHGSNIDKPTDVFPLTTMLYSFEVL